jgi:hypothetical protein
MKDKTSLIKKILAFIAAAIIIFYLILFLTR